MSTERILIEEVTVVRETNAAILILCEGLEFWIPKSQISDKEYEVIDGEEVITGIWIPEWLADEKGLT